MKLNRVSQPDFLTSRSAVSRRCDSEFPDDGHLGSFQPETNCVPTAKKQSGASQSVKNCRILADLTVRRPSWFSRRNSYPAFLPTSIVLPSPDPNAILDVTSSSYPAMSHSTIILFLSITLQSHCCWLISPPDPSTDHSVPSCRRIFRNCPRSIFMGLPFLRLPPPLPPQPPPPPQASVTLGRVLMSNERCQCLPD